MIFGPCHGRCKGKRTKSPNLPTTQHTTADEKKLLKKFEQYKERQQFKTFKKMLKEERRQKKAKKQTRATKLAGSSRGVKRLASQLISDCGAFCHVGAYSTCLS